MKYHAYKVIYYAPEPWLGTRIPIAIVVYETAKSEWSLVLEFKKLPIDYIGPIGMSIVRSGLEALQDNALESLGPHFSFGNTIKLLDVEDQIEWLRTVHKDYIY